MTMLKKMKISGKIVLFGILVFGTVACSSANSDVSQAKAKISTFLAGTGLTVQTSRYIPALELYEFVVNGNQIIYLDKKMKNVFIGDVIDVETKVNHTEKKAEKLELIDFNKLPFDRAVKVTQGNGQVKIAVFTDPDCPFCKKLERDLDKIDNITIYNFLYPIDSLHPKARQRSVQIWCQGNKKSQVWIDYMRGDKAIPKVMECSNPIQKNRSLGDQLGVRGTPVIFLPDGRRLGGYVPYKEFVKIIDQYRKEK